MSGLQDRLHQHKQRLCQLHSTKGPYGDLGHVSPQIQGLVLFFAFDPFQLKAD